MTQRVTTPGQWPRVHSFRVAKGSQSQSDYKVKDHQQHLLMRWRKAHEVGGQTT